MAAPTYSTGDVPTATEVNEFLTNVHFVRRTSDLSRNTTTTFADDTQLTLDVEANAVYKMECGLFFVSSSQTAGDFKAQFTAPAGAALQAGLSGPAAASTASTDDLVGCVTLTTSMSFGVVATGDPFNAGMVWGVLTTAGTSGSFTVQWAQNASSGTNTTLKTNSYIWLYRVS